MTTDCEPKSHKSEGEEGGDAHKKESTLIISRTVSPEGMWMVLGPAFPINLFTSLMLAKVPRAITASFPRRDP